MNENAARRMDRKPMEEWLHEVVHTLPDFLATLRDPLSPARYHPACEGVLPAGKLMGLGFSALALRLYAILGHWERLSAEERDQHIAFIRSYQREGAGEDDLWMAGAFIDPPLIDTLRRSMSLAPSLSEHMLHIRHVVLEESTLAITSLAGVGASAPFRYANVPATPSEILNFLARLDWQRPWIAGMQAAAVAAFLATGHGPAAAQADPAVLNAARRFFRTLVDAPTGAYYSGPPPEYGDMMRGAMRVLSALEWLHEPVHAPERLIDTSLASFPRHEGCHLVDVTYVLYRCSQQTHYRREEISEYSKGLLEMIRLHHNSDGGFSYWIGKSQTAYHGVPITSGLPVSDIHGTGALMWALSMVVRLIDDARLPAMSPIHP